MYEVIPSSLSKNILILITMSYINLMLMILILLMIHKRFAVSTILLSLFVFLKEICAQNQSGDFDLLKFVYIIGKLFFIAYRTSQTMSMRKNFRYSKEKESQSILQIHVLFQRHSGRVSSVHFQALIIKRVKLPVLHKRIATRDNGNVQSHDQEESKLNCTITANRVLIHSHMTN